MKELLKTVKGKILAASAGVVVVATVVVGAVFLFSGEESYRSIAVEQLQGVSLVSDKESEREAYKGMYLNSGEDVQVQNNANLTLKIDADKHLYADALTHFKVECVDGDESGKKVIHLLEGSTLHRLENALKGEESYSVETPNASMAVRGTVFRVTVDRDEDGLTYTLVEVFDGKVQVDLKEENGDYNGITETFGPGESALIRGNTEFAEFVVGDEGVYKQEIAYKQIPQSVAKVLVEYIDDGEELCIGKELLMDYTELSEHKMETLTGKEASCTENGYEEVWCIVCNEVTGTVEIPATGHTMGEWERVQEPTCSEAGKRERVCSTCKTYHEVEAIAALGHIKGEYQVTKKADCAHTGIQVAKCTRCDAVMDELEIPATGHTLSGWEMAQAPTCLEAGKRERVCSTCNTYYDEETIAALGHVKGEYLVTKEADCTHVGTKSAKCTRCGAVVDELEIPATGHTNGTWTTVREASCTTEGLNQIACTVCGQAVQSSTTAALGHSYGAPVVVDPTCTVNGSSTETCATCGDTRTTVLAANGHKPAADMTDHGDPVYNDSQQFVGITCIQVCTICPEEIRTSTTVRMETNDAGEISYWCDNCGMNIPY